MITPLLWGMDSKVEAFYGRRSKQEAADAKRKGRDIHSIAMQRNFARQEAENPTKMIEYIDDGVSGGIAKRPEFERLVDDIVKGKIRRVLIYATDRLARDVDIMRAIVTFFDVSDVKVLFGDFKQTAGENSQLILTILAALAEQFLHSVKTKSLAGQEIAYEKGKWIGRPPSGFEVYPPKSGRLCLTDWAKKVSARMNDTNPEVISVEIGIPVSRIRRAIPRIQAWQSGGEDALREAVKKDSLEGLERLERHRKRKTKEEQDFIDKLVGLTRKKQRDKPLKRRYLDRREAN